MFIVRADDQVTCAALWTNDNTVLFKVTHIADVRTCEMVNERAAMQSD